MTNTAKAVKAVTQAVTLAENALTEAKALLASVGEQQPAANASGKTNKTQSSAGRLPSDEQVSIRDMMQAQFAAGKIGLFTIKSLTAELKKDRVQVRNAVNYLETQGIVMRYAEKLPEGRGQRELIYKPTAFQTGL